MTEMWHWSIFYHLPADSSRFTFQSQARWRRGWSAACDKLISVWFLIQVFIMKKSDGEGGTNKCLGFSVFLLMCLIISRLQGDMHFTAAALRVQEWFGELAIRVKITETTIIKQYWIKTIISVLSFVFVLQSRCVSMSHHFYLHDSPVKQLGIHGAELAFL